MALERKLLAHFIDSAFAQGSATPEYVRLGKDLEEYSIALNPQVEQKANILGENSTKISGYQPQGEVDPYYAEQGDALFDKLQNIIDTRATGDNLKTSVVDVHLWDETSSGSGVYTAFKEDAIVVPSSQGGDTSGVQIPFSVYYSGNRVAGFFTLSTKSFSTTA